MTIRTLPHWSAHPELRARFEAEAKLIAGLQHPHIRALHDIGRERPRPAGDAGGKAVDAEAEASALRTVDGSAPPAPRIVQATLVEGEVNGAADVVTIAEEDAIDFLVLEHLEGETVADRLTRATGATSKKKQAFRLNEALAIAMQLADALDKAHQKGLVHRGLKPSSVFLVRGGKSSDPPVAKLLDFGLAPAKESAPASKKGSGSSSLSLLPTKDQATAQSAIVGDVEYLAPEQVEGKAADARHRPLRLWRRALRNADGEEGVRGQEPRGADGRHHDRRARPVDRGTAARLACDRSRVEAMPRQGS